MHELTDSFVVRADLESTWRFFSTAENLPKITPPWMKFTVDTPSPIVLRQDAVLDYTIRWAGIPLRWKTLIIDWRPPFSFIDLQVKGPYSLWHHQHTFEAVSDGVLCRDRVIYRLPGPVIRRVVHAVMVRPQLLEIFRFRRRMIAESLGGLKPVQDDVKIVNL